MRVSNSDGVEIITSLLALLEDAGDTIDDTPEYRATVDEAEAFIAQAQAERAAWERLWNDQDFPRWESGL